MLRIHLRDYETSNLGICYKPIRAINYREKEQPEWERRIKAQNTIKVKAKLKLSLQQGVEAHTVMRS
jgi:hypothetical protein